MFRKRQVPRVKLNVPAWIEVGNSALLERCTLIDLSEKGGGLLLVISVTWPIISVYI